MRIYTRFFSLRIRKDRFHIRLGSAEYGVVVHLDNCGAWLRFNWGTSSQLLG